MVVSEQIVTSLEYKIQIRQKKYWLLAELKLKVRQVKYIKYFSNEKEEKKGKKYHIQGQERESWVLLLLLLLLCWVT